MWNINIFFAIRQKVSDLRSDHCLKKIQKEEGKKNGYQNNGKYEIGIYWTEYLVMKKNK